MKSILSILFVSLIGLTAWSQEARVVPKKPVSCSNHSGFVDSIYQAKAKVVGENIELNFYLQRAFCEDGVKEVLPMLRRLSLSFFPAEGIAGFSFKSPSYEYRSVNEDLRAVKIYLPLEWLANNEGQLSYEFVIRHYNRDLEIEPTRDSWKLDFKLETEELLVNLR